MKSIWQKVHIILTILCLFGLGIQSAIALSNEECNLQEQITFKEIKGEVVDSNTKKPLGFATLNLLESNISSITNTEGKFILKIPASIRNGKIKISFIGYKSKEVAIAELTDSFTTISLNESVLELQEVNILTLKDATNLVKEVFKNKGDNYLKDPTVMTAFYREIIKKRNRNVSLSEAVVNIYKTPYISMKKDEIKIFKARKSTDYRKLDTIAFKLQGGPFNSLFIDMIKYPKYIFGDQNIEDYNFNFNRVTEINGKAIYVIKFKQNKGVTKPLYKGELYIEPQNKILISAVYSLNITNNFEASKLFVKRKPRNAYVYPKEVIYRVDYTEHEGKWHYSYSNAMLEFKIKWDKKLFNTVYTMNCEMAITDWEINSSAPKLSKNERIKTSIILSDAVSGFSDPNFWGEHNIIEPEKNIESAIRKIQKQLEKDKTKGRTSSAIP